MDALMSAMLEYAQAIRGDWSNFDGRSERAVIESWVEEMKNPTETTLDEWRERLNLCLDGNGHWVGFHWGHCTPEGCPRSFELYGDTT